VCVVFSCTTQEKFVAPIKKLKGTTIQNDSLYIGSTVFLSVIDNSIYTYDIFDENYYTQYNTITNEVARFCRRGKGPGELIWASNVAPAKWNGIDCLSILDIGAKKLIFYKKDSLANLPFEEIALENNIDDHIVYDAFPLNDSIILATGCFSYGKVCKFYKNGKGYGAGVDVFTKFDNNNAIDRATRDGNLFELSPDKKHIVRTAQLGGLIELYKIEGMHLTQLFSQHYFDVTCNPDLSLNPNSRYGYINISVSDDKIYALWDGDLVMRDDPARSKEVHVYDFEGNPIEMLLLDIYVHSIAINSTGNQLYALSRDEKDLLVFNL
jgi:WD40 repeat protein